MDICLSMWSVHKYWYDGLWKQSDFIDFAASAGVKYVELLDNFWGNEADEAVRVLKALDENGVEVGCYSTSNDFVRSDSDERKRELESVITSIDRAVQFNAKVVRVFSGNPNPEVSESSALEWMVDGLKSAAQYAQEKGIVLCLENHGYFAGRAEQVLGLITAVDSPALQATFDTGNFLLVDDNPNTALETLKSCIRHVHFKDFIEVPETHEGQAYTTLTGKRFIGKVPGEGSVDLRGIVGGLKEIGYDGLLTVEYEGNDEQKEGSIQSVARLRHILSTLTNSEHD